MEDDLVCKEEEISDLSDMKIFGVEETTSEVAKVMDSLAFYRY